MPLPPIRNSTSVICLLFSFVCLSSTTAFGQTLEDILASLQLDEEEDILSSDEFLILEDLIRRPINLNEATRRELEDIPLLSPTDVFLLLQRRKKVSGFVSLKNAVATPGLSAVATQLLPLVAAVEQSTPLDMILRNRWMTSGEDPRLLTRVDLSHVNISAGLLVERDPEEPSLLDYVSGYIGIPVGSHTKIILGDHQIKSGYGLLFGRAALPIKGYTDATQLARMGNGLRPYRSTIEYWALRGGAVEHKNRFGRWTFSISASPKDARADSNRSVSLYTSGLHQTESSLGRKHNLREEIGLISWQHETRRTATFGALVARDRWLFEDKQPENRPPKTYGSVFGRFLVPPLAFFGEVASHTASQPSLLAGMTLMQGVVRWVGSLRRYLPGFRGPRSQPFREWGSHDLNEIGLYQALSVRLGRHRFFTYGDAYRQSESKENPRRPVRGFETSASWSFRRNTGTNVSVRWKREEKSPGEGITYPGDSFQTDEKREAWRVNSTLSLNRHVRLQLQGDRIIASHNRTTYMGHGLSGKLHLAQDSWRVSLNWIGYIADDYSARIYLWDLNLPGEMRNRSFSRVGQSMGAFIQLTTTTGAILSVRVRSDWKFHGDLRQWSKPKVETAFQMDIAF